MEIVKIYKGKIMASYVDLIVKTANGVEFYDVNDPFFYDLLHPRFFKIDTSEKYLREILIGWENPDNNFQNAPFENRACLIDFTTKTIYNAVIFPVNEYFMIGIKNRIENDESFKDRISLLIEKGHFNLVKQLKRNDKVVFNHQFKNLSQYINFMKKSPYLWTVINFGEWKYKQVKTLSTIKKRL